MAFSVRNDFDSVDELYIGDDFRQLFVLFNRRQVFDAASMSLKTISFAV
ncbi:hypothetical protein GA0061099_11061, partial [Bradyrhizobium yuanmingense]